MKNTRFVLDGDNPDCHCEVPCPECGDYLNVHMPDPELADRLLATCGECKSWFVMDCNRGELLPLPLPKSARVSRARRTSR